MAITIESSIDKIQGQYKDVLRQLATADSSGSCQRYHTANEAIIEDPKLLISVMHLQRETNELRAYVENNQKLAAELQEQEAALEDFIKLINGSSESNGEGGLLSQLMSDDYSELTQKGVDIITDKFLDDLTVILNRKSYGDKLVFGGANPDYLKAVYDLKDPSIFNTQGELTNSYLNITQCSYLPKLSSQNNLNEKIWAGDPAFKLFIKAAYLLKDKENNKDHAIELLKQGVVQIAHKQSAITAEKEKIEIINQELAKSANTTRAKLDSLITISDHQLDAKVKELAALKSLLLAIEAMQHENKYAFILQHQSIF